VPPLATETARLAGLRLHVRSSEREGAGAGFDDETVRTIVPSAYLKGGANSVVVSFDWALKGFGFHDALFTGGAIDPCGSLIILVGTDKAERVPEYKAAPSAPIRLPSTLPSPKPTSQKVFASLPPFRYHERQIRRLFVGPPTLLRIRTDYDGFTMG